MRFTAAVVFSISCLVATSSCKAPSPSAAAVTAPATTAATSAVTPPAAPPGAFSITGPARRANEAKPEVTWTAAPGAAAYDVKIGSTPTCSTIVAQSSVTTTSYNPGALADGDYFVCLAAVGTGGRTSPDNDSYPFTIKTTSPGSFAIAALPAVGKDNAPTLSWSLSDGAATYSVTISTTANCSSPAQSHPDVAATSQKLTPLDDGDYFVCVTAADGAGNTAAAANDALPFTVKATPPGSFAITGPGGASRTTPTISWSASETATAYSVVVASDASCATAVASVSGLTGTSFALTEPLAAQQDYYLCVTATDAAGNATPASNNASLLHVGSLVLGVASVTTASDASATNVTRNTIWGPSNGDSDGTHVLVVDSHHRVLIWNHVPTRAGQPPDLVLGQPDFTSKDPARGASGLNMPTSACTDGMHVAVADYYNNRVLVWSHFPTTNGEAATFALGQPDFDSDGLNLVAGQATAKNLVDPYDVRCVGGKLIVADAGNNRVLIWNTFPTQMQQAADVVLGQPSFAERTAGTTSATTLNCPQAVASDGTRLAVSDSCNSRVLIWNKIPTTDGAPADVVVGQATMSDAVFGLVTASSLNIPDGLTLRHGKLYVTDTQNNRVLVWDTIPTTDGAAASRVIGQASMTDAAFGPLEAEAFNYALGLFSDETWVYVMDNNNSRVVMLPP
jgi:hypothetical protein